MIVTINKIPDNLFNELHKIIQDKTISYNNNLAGNLKKEFDLSKYLDVLENYVLERINRSEILIDIMEKNFRCNSEARPLKLHSLWVNYMKKHEFNPLHNHSGVFSFIIFMKVPYTAEEQKIISPGKDSNCDMSANLQFVYTGNNGLLMHHNILADKSYEQSMLIFPAFLQHQVYPFYGTDDYRITISGNIVFKV